MTSQSWDADGYSEHAAFVAELAIEVLKLLDAQASENILDLGCGDGVLTRQLKDLGCQMLGVDGSPAMVEKTIALGVEAQVMDGHDLTFDGEFDAVFSNAALHWMTEPEKVVDGVYRSLKKGGRFVAEFGGAGNTNKIMTAISETVLEFGQSDFQLPWYFPTVEEYSSLLQTNNFEVEFIELVDRPTPLESGMRKWLELFTAGITKTLTDTERADFFDRICDKLRPQLFDVEQGWWADYVRLRVKATKT